MRWFVCLLVACGAAPKPTPLHACTSSAFDFLLGSWRGTERDASGKVVATSSVVTERTLGGCVLRERWQVDENGKRLFDAIVLRSFDTKSARWLLSYVDDGGNHQFYEGRENTGRWRFFRERPDPDGGTVLVRITWEARDAGYLKMIERSKDGGATWMPSATVTFER